MVQKFAALFAVDLSATGASSRRPETICTGVDVMCDEVLGECQCSSFQNVQYSIMGQSLVLHRHKFIDGRWLCSIVKLPLTRQ